MDVNNLFKNYDFNKYMLKKIGNLYLSDAHVQILKSHNIDYEKLNNINLLIYEIQEVLDEEESEELEWVLNELAEFNYYNNTNK